MKDDHQIEEELRLLSLTFLWALALPEGELRLARLAYGKFVAPLYLAAEDDDHKNSLRVTVLA